MAIGFSQLSDLDTAKSTTSADTAAVLGKDVEGRTGVTAELARADHGAAFWTGADADTQNALVTEPAGAERDIERAIASYPEHTVGDDGGTPAQRPDNHPWAPTENGLRDEHGGPPRESYR